MYENRYRSNDMNNQGYYSGNTYPYYHYPQNYQEQQRSYFQDNTIPPPFYQVTTIVTRIICNTINY